MAGEHDPEFNEDLQWLGTDDMLRPPIRRNHPWYYFEAQNYFPDIPVEHPVERWLLKLTRYARVREHLAGLFAEEIIDSLNDYDVKPETVFVNFKSSRYHQSDRLKNRFDVDYQPANVAPLNPVFERLRQPKIARSVAALAIVGTTGLIIGGSVLSGTAHSNEPHHSSNPLHVAPTSAPVLNVNHG